MLVPLLVVDCADAEAERQRRRAAWSDLADAAGRIAELAMHIDGSGAEAVLAMARAMETLAGSCVSEETAELHLAAAQVRARAKAVSIEEVGGGGGGGGGGDSSSNVHHVKRA